MDPEATLQMWRDAVTRRDRNEAAENLRNWIARGGFEPQWRPGEREAVMRGAA